MKASAENVKSPLKTEASGATMGAKNSLKKAEYSGENVAWTVDRSVLTEQERIKFFHLIADINKLGHKVRRSSQGGYIVDIGNKLLFTDGNWNAPSLSNLIIFDDTSETSMRIAKDVIFNGKHTKTGYEKSRQIIEDTYWPGYVQRYTEQNSGSYARENAGRKGADRGANYEGTRDQVGKKFSLKLDSEGNTLTEQQAEYFKDSKARDDQGRLKPMYHGTNADKAFTVFDTYGGKFGLFGTGSYFTDNRDIAESYTKKGKGKNPRVYEVYLNAKNPLDMDAKGDRAKWEKSAPEAKRYFARCETNEDFFKSLKEYCMDEEMVRWETEELITNVILDMGYDSITHIGGGRFGSKDGPKHQVYIIFEPDQAKNTDNTSPTGDADIRHSLKQDEAQRIMNEEEASNGREQKETRADFLRRAAGRGYEVKNGNKTLSYGYKAVRRGSAKENARQVQKELKALGIDADIIEGDVLWNRDGVTHTKVVKQATTVDNSHILISNNVDIDARNVAGHEAFHLWGNSAAKEDFIDTVQSNLRFSSQAFIKYQEEIASAYRKQSAQRSQWDKKRVDPKIHSLIWFIPLGIIPQQR